MYATALCMCYFLLTNDDIRCSMVIYGGDEMDNSFKYDEQLERTWSLKRDIDTTFQRGIYNYNSDVTKIETDNNQDFVLDWISPDEEEYKVTFTKEEFLVYVIKKAEENNVIDNFNETDIFKLYEKFIANKIMKTVLLRKGS